MSTCYCVQLGSSPFGSLKLDRHSAYLILQTTKKALSLNLFISGFKVRFADIRSILRTGLAPTVDCASLFAGGISFISSSVFFGTT